MVCAEIVDPSDARSFTGAVQYREATSMDVPAMERCRAADHAAGPADARVSAYLEGHHHPQQALAPRVAFVALHGADVVGYIAGHATTRYECDGEVQYLYVAPGHRRSGVAGQLLRRLTDWFGRQSIRRVCVNADVASAGAVPFYTAYGARPLNRYWFIWDDMRATLSGIPRH